MSAPDLSPSFYDTWVSLSRRLGVDPYALARVSFAETGMYRRHPRNANAGVWPFIESTLRRLGWTGTAYEFTALSPEDQVSPWLERYLAPYAGYLTDEAMIYVAMFLPAHLARAQAGGDSHVLTSAGDASGYYESNRVLDRNSDGRVTVGDLRTHLDIQDRGARWESISREIRSRAGSSGDKSRKALVILASTGLLAWGLWEISKNSPRRQANR